MSVSVTAPNPPAPAPVARARDTAVLIAILLAVAGAGAYFQLRGAPGPPAAGAQRGVIGLYVSLLAAEWGLFLYVRHGLRRAGTSLAAIVGGRWARPRDVARDLALGLGVWLAWHFLEYGWDRVAGAGGGGAVAGYLPRTALESALWVLLSLSAGFVEELVFRGYLQRQFTAWTRRPWLGLGLQALLFGIGHGYQGVGSALRIAAYGALFGAVAWWRRSLRPGMIAHALTDLLAGLFRI